MKWLVFICFFIVFFISFNANAQGVVCPAEESAAIDKLGQALSNCMVDYGEDEWRTSEMLKAYDRAIDCMQGVAYQIFDRYYTHNNKTVKAHFDNYVHMMTDISHDVIQGSDWGGHIRTAEVYTLQAAGRAQLMVRTLVWEYIKEIRDECAEAYDFAKEMEHEPHH